MADKPSTYSNGYIVGFAALVCVVCSVFVAGSAVFLKPRQEENKTLDRQKKVLSVAGHDDVLSMDADKIRSTYEEEIVPRVINLKTGEIDESIDVASFDQRKASRDPARSEVAPPNDAKVQRLPTNALVYDVVDKSGNKTMVILPIQGYGLWSTLYGFLALDKDLNTIRGITFYEHGETPGLGGEVDNPKWKALWPGRKAFGPSGEVAIKVLKGQAGPVGEDPHHVDGLSGATITSRGVSHLVGFWLGPNGFGPYLERVRSAGEAS